jgi:uncharacterized protein (DUF2252 family)
MGTRAQTLEPLGVAHEVDYLAELGLGLRHAGDVLPLGRVGRLRLDLLRLVRGTSRIVMAIRTTIRPMNRIGSQVSANWATSSNVSASRAGPGIVVGIGAGGPVHESRARWPRPIVRRMRSVDDLTSSPDERQREIVEVLADAFSDLIQINPRAFRRKFRKMAAEPFDFYRGSAPLFYHDVDRIDDPYADERTSRVWIQGDLHAENYGTYMDSEGLLVFDVNDFDEAYVGHFTWDLQRMAASLALLGFSKAFPDRKIREMVETYARAYLDQVRNFASTERDEEFRLTLENSEGAIYDILVGARSGTRVGLLDRLTLIEEGERRFRDSAGERRLDFNEQVRVMNAFESYLETIPEQKRQESISYRVKDAMTLTGVGIGSAGQTVYSLLVEGRTQALENDVILSIKRANVPAPSRVVRDERIRGYFQHQGHRTALSQRALQAHSDPWLGWCELDGHGQVVQELSPYANDVEWDRVTEPDEMLALLGGLGRATAKVHCVSDASSDQTLVDFETESAILDAIGDGDDDFVEHLCKFGASYGERTREDHRLFVDAFRNGMIPGVEAT